MSIQLETCPEHGVRLAEAGESRLTVEAIVFAEGLIRPATRDSLCLCCRLDPDRFDALLIEGCRIRAMVDAYGNGLFTIQDRRRGDVE